MNLSTKASIITALEYSIYKYNGQDKVRVSNIKFIINELRGVSVLNYKRYSDIETRKKKFIK